MEAQSALVGADGAVHLDAESTVDLNVALVVEPRHAEHDDALGLDNSFEQTRRLILGVFRKDQPERVEHFCYRLVEFGLGGILRFHTDHHGFNVVRGNLDSRGCHHRHRSYLRRYNIKSIMPLFILGLYWNGAVIILTRGRDYGSRGWMWSGMRGLQDRADVPSRAPPCCLHSERPAGGWQGWGVAVGSCAIIDCSAIIDCMASITIRNLEEATKRKLKIRAAMNGRSMEQEAREILKSALGEKSSRQKHKSGPIWRNEFGRSLALGRSRVGTVFRANPYAIRIGWKRLERDQICASRFQRMIILDTNVVSELCGQCRSAVLRWFSDQVCRRSSRHCDHDGGNSLRDRTHLLPESVATYFERALRKCFREYSRIAF